MAFHRVISIQEVTNRTFIIRMERKGMEFTAGQYLQVGIPGEFAFREYSIFSSETDNYLEILVTHVKSGYYTQRLKSIGVKEFLEIDGPFGNFTLDKEKIDRSKYLFIASGPGIAPFHSFVTSYPKINYKLIHGLSSNEEIYGMNYFNPKSIYPFIDKDKISDYLENTTNYFKEPEVNSFNYFYLCGHGKMIDDGIQFLRDKGFKKSQYFTEVYFK